MPCALPAQTPVGSEKPPIHTFDYKLSDHVTAVIACHKTREPTSAFQDLEALKGPGGGSGKGLIFLGFSEGIHCRGNWKVVCSIHNLES